jgi:hypothetical protein
MSRHRVTFHEKPARHADQDVTGWRESRLLAAGFDARVAFDFAQDWAVDLHELLELVDRGCRPDLAARILAPLDYKAASDDPSTRSCCVPLAERGMRIGTEPGKRGETERS